MYASDESVELSELQIKALDKLYELGYEKGVYFRPMKTEEHLIPREYEELRNS